MSNVRLLKNMGLYFLSVFSTKVLQFLFIPIYSRYISPSDFGYYSLALSLIALLIPLLYQSIWEGLLRFIIERESERRKILNTTLIYCAGLTIVYACTFFIVVTILEIEFGLAILLMGLSQMAVFYWQFSARALTLNKVYALSTVMHSCVVIILELVLNAVEFE